MGKYSRSLCVTLAACALGASAIPALAQVDTGPDLVTPAPIAKQQRAEIAKGDPQRWYKAPTSDAARLRIQKDEIAAAYREARTACRQVTGADTGECLKEARMIYERDMRNAQGLVAMAPTSSVTESSGPVDTSGAASTAVGGSGAGSTGSGGSGMDRGATGTGQTDAATGQPATSGAANAGAVAPPPEKPRSDRR